MATLPYDTNELLKRGQALLDQSKAQGATPFAGSSFDTPEAQQLAKTDPIALANFQKANPGLNFGTQDLAQYNAAVSTPFDGTKINAQGIQNLPQAEAEASTIQKQIAERQKLQEQYAAQAAVTPEETNLETQLADIRAKSEQGLIGTRYDIQALPTEGISATGIDARGRELTTEEGRRQEIMASQEKLLSTRLGIAQEKRKSATDTIKEKLGFKKEDIDIEMKMQDAIDKQNSTILAAAEKLNDNARQNLSLILGQFKDKPIDFEDLDPQAQLQLSQIAAQNGIPASLLVSSMKATKDNVLLDQANEARKQSLADAREERLIAQVASGMNNKDRGVFVGISTNYQKDPVVQNGLKAEATFAIADQVIADPGSAANQLKALYTLVKTLDPDSAVREGEVDLAQAAQSYIDKFKTSYTRIFEGRIISPDTALELAKASKELAQVRMAAASRRTRDYSSQANIAGVGNDFNQYIEGAKPEKIMITPPQTEDEAKNELDKIVQQPQTPADAQPQAGWFGNFLKAFK